MTQPDDSAPVLDGTDISADPEQVEDSELDPQDRPATSDPEQLTDDGQLGGAGGPGGAG